MTSTDSGLAALQVEQDQTLPHSALQTKGLVLLSLLLLSLALGFGPRQTRAQGWEGPLEGAVVFCLKPAQAAAIRRSSCEKQRSASMRHTKDQQKLRTKAGKNVLPYRHCMTMFP